MCPLWLKILPFHPRSPVNEALDAVFQIDHVKVDEQSNRLAAELEVGDDLRVMDGRNPFHGLDFHDYEIFDQEIDWYPRSSFAPR